MPVPPSDDPAAFFYYARLRRVKEYLEANIVEELSLPRAAGIAAMSETYFSVFFHEKVGLCFRDWVHTVRLARAKQLMRTGNRSITTVAYEVGFGSLRTFERVFKKHVSMTAREFRRSLSFQNRNSSRDLKIGREFHKD